MITLDSSNLAPAIREEEIYTLQPLIQIVHDQIHKKTCDGKDFLGWVDLPGMQSESVLDEILGTAKNIGDDPEIDTLLFIGIGGSYLGTRAVLEAVHPSSQKNLLFAGHHLSSYYYKQLLDQVDWKKTAVNVISKSGTTTEPAIAFRLVLQEMERALGKDSSVLRNRIIATTDASKGALRSMADQQGWKSFIVPDDIGGRYSVFTPVGLLPLALAGVQIRSLLAGAKQMMEQLTIADISSNVANRYAATRFQAYLKGYMIEKMVAMHPALFYILAWWEQLFGESEGKDNKGLYPSYGLYTTDLHSMGQYLQDGRRIILETFLHVQQDVPEITIPVTDANQDGLNALVGDKTMDFVNTKALEGTMAAHHAGGTPNQIVSLSSLNEEQIGAVLYFFMKACAISGLLLGVNPFNQPGVEDYKREMKRLLEP
jgi:glucose-6-phosphate isomerase